MNIESKIRFKTFALYGMVIIAMVAMLFFLYSVRGNTRAQRSEVEEHRRLFQLTNDLIYAVGQTQSAVGRYVTTEDKRYAGEFRHRMNRIDSLILLLSQMEGVESAKLSEISTLLKQQSRNVFEIRRQFVSNNPIDPINERLRNFEPERKSDTILVTTIRRDTVINRPPKRNFFQRVGEIFKPQKDSLVVVSNRRVDTIRVEETDTLPILSEVDHMARQAGETYRQSMRTLQQQVHRLNAADQKISERISTLLLQLYSRTLDSTVQALDASEQAVARGYTFLIAGGVILLGLMLLFILMIMADLRRWKEARAALEEANRLLREVMESRHRLLLAVAHDIKSPLNSIMGYLDLSPTESEEVRSMRNSSRHILALLENLLEFSSLEQGTLQTTQSVFDLQVLGHELGEMFAPLAQSKELEFAYQSDAIRLKTDQMKLKQIVINLLSNAVKYTRRGKIALSMSYREGTITVVVEDTGAGIPEEKIEELFEPFTRIESNNTLAHGSGLGMYVVKGLLDLLNGTIDVRSEVGKGTTITVSLPAQEVVEEVKKGSKRIALYDDDPVVLTVTRDLLTRLGHLVVSSEYDCVLTDMEMGSRTGLDVLAETTDVPVYVMTGRSDFTYQKALDLGFSGYIAKPFTIEDLRNLFGEGDTLDDFLGDDREEILSLFRTTTAENFRFLTEALTTNDFKQAQALCHKMYPMFAQLGYPTEALRRMDSSRGAEYEGWHADVEAVLGVTV